MAFPLILSDDSLPANGHASTVRFTTRGRHPGRHNPNIDAAWWPRSSNLAAELADLLQAAQESGFRATHVAYRLDDAWTAPPRRIAFGARIVKVSGYHNHHQNTVTLVDGASHERLQVMVVPSNTSPLLAERTLRIAVDHADPAQATEILALARDGMYAAVVTA